MLSSRQDYGTFRFQTDTGSQRVGLAMLTLHSSSLKEGASYPFPLHDILCFC